MFWVSVRVGFLLGIRQIQRSSIWIKVLVISVMVLVFLNLVAVGGILVGLIAGAEQANREQYTGELILTTPADESFIENTPSVIETLKTIPEITVITARYNAGATIEANYRQRRDFSTLADTASTVVVGIDPQAEDEATGLGSFVVDGEYLEQTDDQYIIIGANLLERNLENFGNTDFQGIADVYPGSKVRVTVNGNTQEYTVKGIADAKGGETSLRAYMTSRELRKLAQRTHINANEIAVRTTDIENANLVKQKLLRSGIGDTAVIETWQEAQGQFLNDIKDTFGLLGAVIGFIGLIVAAITIFIIIFINAVTRRKFIGILKGIGISETAIEISYIFQSLFYGIVGSVIGLAMVYMVLVPYFAANPINFPFSDGILSAPIGSTMVRLVILIISTVIAGFIPARMIVRKNTLDSILGR